MIWEAYVGIQWSLFCADILGGFTTRQAHKAGENSIKMHYWLIWWAFMFMDNVFLYICETKWEIQIDCYSRCQ